MKFTQQHAISIQEINSKCSGKLESVDMPLSANFRRGKLIRKQLRVFYVELVTKVENLKNWFRVCCGNIVGM